MHEVIWGHSWVCYQRSPGPPCVKWQWALLFWWGIFNFRKYLKKSWGRSPMSQVFREVTEKRNKNVWETWWSHAIVLSDGFLDIAAKRFPPHSPSTAIQAPNGLNHISPPDLQWLTEMVFFRNRKKPKHSTGHNAQFSMTVPTHKGKMKSPEQTSAAPRGLTSSGKESFPAPRKGWEYHLPLGT